MDVYKSIITGLNEAIEYEKGNGKARTSKIVMEPVRVFKAEEIKGIRNSSGMTQLMFAGFFGVSPKTVEAWEAGRNMPDGPARRILSMLQQDPKLPEKFNIIYR